VTAAGAAAGVVFVVVVSSITAEIAGEEPVMPDRTGSEEIMGTDGFSSSPVRGD
jgi:hypothetical protein